MKGFLSFTWETIKVVFIALLIVIPIRYFIFQPFIVSGQSMEPNFRNGDYLIVDEISYRFRDPQRGEVIVFRFPEDPSYRHIKRIIGLPQETIILNREGIAIVFPDGERVLLDESDYLENFGPGSELIIALKDNEYFVMGDNRQASFDSRRWGALPQENIIGRFLIRVLPFSRMQAVEIPSY